MSYAPAFHDNNPSGFSNNWLEARKSTHFFDQNYSDYALYENNGRPNNSYRDILKAQVARSPLSDAYFSNDNIQHMKHLICQDVLNRSNGQYRLTAEAQSDDALLLVMRSIFLDNCRNLPENIPGQIAELNLMVLNDMVPRVLSNVRQKLSFIRDHSQRPLTMDRPAYVGSAGTRSLDMTSKSFI